MKTTIVAALAVSFMGLMPFQPVADNCSASHEKQVTTTKYAAVEKKNYYCEYCGHKFPDVRLLTSATCSRHPDGPNKGRHKLYEGTEKSSYICKYCGKKFPSILVMTGATCTYHPNGSNKGNHAPAL